MLLIVNIWYDLKVHTNNTNVDLKDANKYYNQ